MMTSSAVRRFTTRQQAWPVLCPTYLRTDIDIHKVRIFSVLDGTGLAESPSAGPGTRNPEPGPSLTASTLGDMVMWPGQHHLESTYWAAGLVMLLTQWNW